MKYKKIKADNLDVFYREAGDKSKPARLLLPGFPASSLMFRDLMRDLEDRYYLVAPDHPGFGWESFSSVAEFEYIFDRLAQLMESFVQALGLKKMAIYVMDCGAPAGFRTAAHHRRR